MKIYFFIIFSLFTISLIANHKSNDSIKIGVGIGIGYRNFNGFGCLGYCRKNKFEINAALGGTGYNGTNLPMGTKYFLTINKKINPFLSLNYTYTLHENIQDDRESKYFYKTSNNQYAMVGLGFFIPTKKKHVEHHLVLGIRRF